MIYLAEIRAAATALGLEPRIVAGLITIESGANPWAWNPEPKYRYMWDVKLNRPFRALSNVELDAKFPPHDFHSLLGDPDNEWWGQQASWGLMQVMGAVAREMGFVGPYLTELCDPMKNLTIGCKHLKQLFDWSHGTVEQALAAYNGGKGGNEHPPYRNALYAAKIMNVLPTLEV